MKKGILLLVLLVCLSGCRSANGEMEAGMALRTQILKGSKVNFQADIVADYSDALHEFSMDCEADSQGELKFTVTAPQTIAGIAGTIGLSGGAITFDDHALSFPLMADGQISPISSPWVFLKTLRSGCLSWACREGEGILLAMDDSYREEPLHLDIWLNRENVPERCEILYENRRILTLLIHNFSVEV